MKNKKLSRAGLLSLLLLVYAISYGANYKMVCDDLDQLGGKSSSPNFNLAVSAGGQPTPIGVSQSDSSRVLAGYVYATFVLHGDANASGIIDAADVVYLINYLYIHGPEPIPLEAGDVNCDGKIDAADVVYLINYLYINGPPPCDP